MTKITP